MDTKELPQVDEASKRIVAHLESAAFDDDPRSEISSDDIAAHIEKMALENARLIAKNEQLEQECAQLREELASIDTHVSKSPSSRPPKGGS